MSSPANLYPGLNDIADVLEEFPLETSRYLTLLHEIDAKCVLTNPILTQKIEKFLAEDNKESLEDDKLESLKTINQYLEELMPSFEEKMHVSSIMLESLQRLTTRMELAYEVAIKNEEIPSSLRLGVDNHPAMHLHHELMQKVDHKSNSKSTQAQKSELRREAMAAKKTDPQQTQGYSGTNSPQVGSEKNSYSSTVNEQGNTRKRGNPDKASNNNVGSNGNENKKRKRRVATTPATPTTTTKNAKVQRPKTNDYGEPLYCYCNQIAYGEMVGCDGEDCELEWFHLPCIGFETIPKGKWYCEDCKKKLQN
ncbi:Transcriptional regulatory protein PHO23 [Nakaseomyces bracarensis]|uniref:Chromatin modification-related protein n=1 Tax=Nakaseomyces bracarensis TaxID=273131 RepID=A0ABR4NMT1_9SACH